MSDFITEAQQEDLMYAIVGTFGASPGRTVFNSLAQDVINGASQEDVFASLVAHPLFGDATIGVYPAGQTPSSFATDFLTQLIGARGDLVVASLWDEAKAVVIGEINGGASKLDIVILATNTCRMPTPTPISTKASVPPPMRWPTRLK